MICCGRLHDGEIRFSVRIGEGSGAMFSKFKRMSAVAVLAGGVAMLVALVAEAEPTQVIGIKVKKVVLYEAADGNAVLRKARDDIELPLGIKDISPNGRFLVTIDGRDLWIPKSLTKTDDALKAGDVAVNCQSITKSYATSRGFVDCK